MSPKKQVTKKSTKSTKSSTKKAVSASKKKPAAAGKKESKEEKEKRLLEARKRKATPSIFKVKSRKHTPIVFTLEDVKDILKDKPEKAATKRTKAKATAKGKTTKATKPKRQVTKKEPVAKKRVLGAASIADILGFNPNDAKSKPHAQIEEERIPKKFLPYYKSLIELRNQVKEGLDLHTEETLKRSSKDDSGDLSSYSQHMADAGTDTFDRDFALSLVSNEQDALFEIEEAIQRIIEGSYGNCEITGKPIARDRLKAVPFTRYSLEGQQQLEATQHTSKERGGVFAESSLEESAKYTNQETES